MENLLHKIRKAQSGEKIFLCKLRNDQQVWKMSYKQEEIICHMF